MMRYRVICVGITVALGVVAAASCAMGEDLVPPDWRGAPNSTMQLWEFYDDANPDVPDVDANPYGTALATIYGEFDYPLKDTFWIDVDNLGREGVWCVGGSISLDIPNDPIPRPEKHIRVQLTYDGGLTVPEPQPWIEVIADNGAETVAFDLVERTVLDEYYVHDTYDILLQPNPGFETIWIVPYYCQIYVDEIVVDTICIPEPSTLVLAVIGVAFCAFSRRRR